MKVQKLPEVRMESTSFQAEISPQLRFEKMRNGVQRHSNVQESKDQKNR